MSATAAQLPPKPREWHGPPPPAELTDETSSLQLLSQGAEARVWLVTLSDSPSNSRHNDDGNDDGSSGRKQRTVHVGSGINVPQLLSFSQQPSPLSPPSSATDSSQSSRPLKFVCKERFPKKYRHPQLDVSLTKSRTKGEARSLVRCQKADVPCPNVFAIAQWSNKSETNECDNQTDKKDSTSTETSTTSSCIFLEYVEGCAVRQYFEHLSTAPLNNGSADVDKGGEPATKRPRCEESTTDTSNAFQQEERVTTVINTQTLCVAHTIGTVVAKMHAAGVIHGDLTTSNIMIRNPPWQSGEGGTNIIETDASSWVPQLVLIDFGLAASTAIATTNKANNATNNKKVKPFKQQHNAEEKAVDLYVLERAFLSTHPESEVLVEEVWKGYRSHFESLDNEKNDSGVAGGEGESNAVASEGVHGHVANAVLNRLEQVRMRGRKRECFG